MLVHVCQNANHDEHPVNVKLHHSQMYVAYEKVSQQSIYKGILNKRRYRRVLECPDSEINSYLEG